MRARVGEEVESRCRRCGDVWHVVIALVDGEIAQVECGECHRVHRHRGPSTAAKTGRAGRTSRAGRAEVSERPIVEAGDGPVRDYRVTECFRPGERVRHAKFGEGVVQYSAGPGKVRIRFGGENRLLVHDKRS
jgi:uncharacterized Zn finger protein